MEMGDTAVMLPELDFDEQIALCKEAGVKYYQYRPRVIAPDQRDKPYSNWGNHKFDLTPDRLIKEGAELTKRLRDAGLEPWGTVPALSINMRDDEIKLHLEGAAAAQARGVRCGPPSYPGQPFDYEALLARVLDRYAHVIQTVSGPMGIKLILETHCGTMITSPGLAWNVVHHFSPEQIGVIFDVANFGREGEVSPVLAVSVLRNHIDCVHIGGNRRIITDVDPLGFTRRTGQMCRMEEGDLYLPAWVKAIHDAGIDPPLIIEDFTPNMSGADRLRQSAAGLKKMIAAL